MRCHGPADAQGHPPQLTERTGREVHGLIQRAETLCAVVPGVSGVTRASGKPVSLPGHCGADQSPLLDVLADANHAPHVRMPAADLQRLTIWLDANAPFFTAPTWIRPSRDNRWVMRCLRQPCSNGKPARGA